MEYIDFLLDDGLYLACFYGFLEAVFVGDPLIITQVAKELNVDQFYGCSAFGANWKGE